MTVAGRTGYRPTESKYKGGAHEMYVTYDLEQKTRGGDMAIYPKVRRVYIAGDVNLVDLRFPVQRVVRPDQDFRGYAGQVLSGIARPGDEVVVLPSGQTATRPAASRARAVASDSTIARSARSRTRATTWRAPSGCASSSTH